MNRKLLTASLAAVATIAMLAGCSGAQSEPDSSAPGVEDLGTLRVATSAIKMEFVPAEMGKEIGAWSDRGLEVEVTPGLAGTGPLTQLMAGGQIDIGWVGALGAANAIAGGGLEAKIIAQVSTDWRNTPVIVGADNKMKGLEDLKGSTMGYSSPGSITDRSIDLLCAHFGWEREVDLHSVQVGGLPELTAAVQVGQIDAFAWSQEPGFQLEESGDGRILEFLGASAEGVPGDVIIASDKAIAERGPAIRAYLEGLRYTQQYMIDNNDEVVTFVEASQGQTPFVIESTLVGWMDNVNLEGALTDDMIQYLVEDVAVQNSLSTPPAGSTVYDDQFVPIKLN